MMVGIQEEMTNHSVSGIPSWILLFSELSIIIVIRQATLKKKHKVHSPRIEVARTRTVSFQRVDMRSDGVIDIWDELRRD
jgi:hypothetical protein